MNEYKWAVNLLKLNRAIALANGDESKIKELYISFGGLIKKGYEEVSHETEVVSEVTGTEVEEVAEKLAEEVIATPKKKGRPSKNA
jgi:hypothetical protein